MDCRLRLADWDDVGTIYRWANETAVRANSFCTEPIPYEVHERWFRSLLDDPMRRQYILLADGEEVGQLRLTKEDDTVEVGYSVAPEQRGRGFGKLLLKMAAEQAGNDFPDAQYLMGKVKPENEPSRRAFLSAGFSEHCVEYRLAL